MLKYHSYSFIRKQNSEYVYVITNIKALLMQNNNLWLFVALRPYAPLGAKGKNKLSTY